MLPPRKVTLKFSSVQVAVEAFGSQKLEAPEASPCLISFGSFAEAARELQVSRAALHNAVTQGYRVRGAEVIPGKRAK